jgi:AcrR family transcriptional regulator
VNRWERKRRERIDSILAVTARELTERGYHHMSLEDVASALDLTKASLYHYFDSKEDLVFNVLQVCANDVIDNLREAAVSEGSPTERLREMIKAQVRTLVREYPEFVTLFLRMNHWPEDIAKQVLEWREEHDALFRDVLHDGIAAGEFDVVDERIARYALHGAMNNTPTWIPPRHLNAELLDAVAAQFLYLVGRGEDG